MRDLVIVGGGIAGLRVAHHAHKEGVDWHLLEQGSEIGMRSRMRTKYSKDGVPLYDAGAWRVHEDHKRMNSLLGELDIELVPSRGARTVFAPLEGTNFFDLAIHKGYDAACKAEMKTGYIGVSDGAKPVYGAKIQRGDNNFGVVAEGMQHILRTMAALLPDRCITLGWVLRRIERTSRGTYKLLNPEGKAVECRRVALALSPHQLAMVHLGHLRRHFSPALGIVQSNPLHHLYVKTKHPREFRPKVHPGLGGMIPSTQDPHWCQAGYSGGRLATAWHTFITSHSKKSTIALVKKMTGWDDIVDVRSEYWRYATHMWTHLPSKLWDVLEVHPFELPGVVLCNEAWSFCHGWAEGALESADTAWSILERPTSSTMRVVSAKHVVVDRRVVDVSTWKHRHPGTKAPLDAHKGKEVVKAMEWVGHSPDAWGRVLAMQVGWCK